MPDRRIGGGQEPLAEPAAFLEECLQTSIGRPGDAPAATALPRNYSRSFVMTMV